MKTLADFKRRLILDTKVKVTFHGGPLTIRGNTATTVMPPPEPREQVVCKVQNNAVAFMRQDGKESWLYWPKAADFKVSADGKAEIYQQGKLILTYEFV